MCNLSHTETLGEIWQKAIRYGQTYPDPLIEIRVSAI